MNNVYTTMIYISLVALVASIITLWIANVEMTGELQPTGQAIKNPFYIVQPSQLQ